MLKTMLKTDTTLAVTPHGALSLLCCIPGVSPALRACPRLLFLHPSGAQRFASFAHPDNAECIVRIAEWGKFRSLRLPFLISTAARGGDLARQLPDFALPDGQDFARAADEDFALRQAPGNAELRLLNGEVTRASPAGILSPVGDIGRGRARSAQPLFTGRLYRNPGNLW